MRHWPTRVFLLVSLIGPGCFESRGQRLLKGEQARMAEAVLRKFLPGTPACLAEWRRPALDFGFRFVAPLQVWLPTRRFAGKDKEIGVVMRVTPEGHEPAYLSDRVIVPGDLSAETRANVQVVGAVLVGPGAYSLDLLMLGQSGGLCAVHKKAVARLAGLPGGVRPSLEPGEVIGLSTPPWASVRKTAAGRSGGRLTILLHAQSARASAGKISAVERNILLGSLASLVRESSFSSFRVVAFNLEQQTEVFRQEELDTAGYARLAEALERVQLGAVPYAALQKRRGAQDLLAELVDGEILSRTRAEAVVIVGWTGRLWEKAPPIRIEEAPRPLPQFFYLNYQHLMWYGWKLPAPPDVIEQSVKTLDGRTIPVYGPKQLAAALREINGATRAAAASR